MKKLTYLQIFSLNNECTKSDRETYATHVVFTLILGFH